MKLTFKLFLLELKRTVKFLPRIIICFAVLFAFLYAAVLLGEKSDTKADIRVNIAYFNPENDPYISMLVNMVSEMDSVKSICTLEGVESEQAVYDGIKSGKYYGGVVFPYEYIQGVIDGEDNPAKVIVPGGSDNPVFRRLVAVGSDMLVSVQAGIYTTADGKTLSRAQLIGINIEYVNFVMARNDLFKNQSWSPYGTLRLAQYYCIMALSLLVMLVGSCLAFLFYDYTDGFKSYCRLWNYSPIIMFVLKQLLVFGVVAAVAVPSLKIADKMIPFVDVNVVSLLAAIFIAAQVITCFYTVFGGSAVLLLTAFTAVTAFFSGCFVPLVYLSGAGLDKVCGFMPVYTVTQCFSSLYTYNKSVDPLVMIGGIYIVTAVLCAVKRKVVH